MAASPLSRLARLFRSQPPALLEPSFQVGRAKAPSATRKARGTPDKNPELRQIVVRVDVATFERISRAAERGRVTVSEAIRQLIARGLDARPVTTPTRSDP